MNNEINIPPKKNIPIPPKMNTMPNIQSYPNIKNNNDQNLDNDNNSKKTKNKLNEQAKSILLAMFSAICFIGAIACFVLMFVI